MRVDHETDEPPVLLTHPRDGVPDVVADPAGLRTAIEMLTEGNGPVAVDAERASGFRYLPRAYLIQLRRQDAGTVLIDPIAFDDLSAVNEVLHGSEWILHAASQDLPCLSDIGMRPATLFDTELAARLCGFERVGLAALTEKLLGYSLEKHHSAADWSTRPLPADWLTYAALDVELLADLREILDAELRDQGKRDWADQEFTAVMNAAPPAPRPEPWRRTSGIHRVRGARGLARVRALWEVRDAIAQRLDKAPSKVVPDLAIADAAISDPRDFAQLVEIAGFQRRHGRSHAKKFLAALSQARKLPDSQLPAVTPTSDGPPAPHRWAARDPAAAQRLQRARTVVNELADSHRLPAENLIAPASIRALCWRPPHNISDETVRDFLTGHGARDWQIEILRAALAEAIVD